jgi:hypothetical protein
MARNEGGRERREKSDKFQNFSRPKVKVAKTTANGTTSSTTRTPSPSRR